MAAEVTMTRLRETEAVELPREHLNWLSSGEIDAGAKSTGASKSSRLIRSGLAVAILLALALARGESAPASVQPRVFATLAIPALSEASGLAPSWLRPGTYWTHNDSPNKPPENFLYAFDKTGKLKARVRVTGAVNRDWEDISIGPGAGGNSALYVGDIGDGANRSQHPYTIYRIPEPDTLRATAAVHPDRTWTFTLPGGTRDFETLMVHPKTGRLYVVTKEKGRIRRSGDKNYEATNEVYKITPGKATRIGQFKTRSIATFGCLTTGGDFRRDGRAFVIRTYSDAYEFALRPGETMASALKRPPKKHALPLEPQGEAICYRLDGKAWLTCSERIRGWTTVYEIQLSR